MNDSQYLRVKNIMTSLALWTVIAYQTLNTAPAIAGERNASGAYIMLAGKSVVRGIANVFAVVAVIALVTVMIVCPPAAAIVPSVFAPIAPIITPVVATAALFAPIVGAAVLHTIADNMPDEDPPPPPSPIAVTGDPGPGGGILVGSLEGTDFWLEVARKDIGSFRLLGGAAAQACADYVVTVNGRVINDWYLPGIGELQAVYDNLYKTGKMPDCQSDFYWSSSPANSTLTNYITVNFSDGSPDPTNIGISLLVLPVRRVSKDEIIAFKEGNG